MSQELRAAIAELTRDGRPTSRSEVYETYFRDADRAKFEQTLHFLSGEGIVANRPHPRDPRDRVLMLTDIGRSPRVPYGAIERGRRRRRG